MTWERDMKGHGIGSSINWLTDNEVHTRLPSAREARGPVFADNHAFMHLLQLSQHPTQYNVTQTWTVEENESTNREREREREREKCTPKRYKIW
jgi:hypothetical protein